MHKNKVVIKLEKLFKDLKQNNSVFEKDFFDCSDFLKREVKISGFDALIMAMDGLVDSKTVAEAVSNPVLNFNTNCKNADVMFNQIKEMKVSASEITEVTTFDEVKYFLMGGFVAIIIDGCNKALCLGTQGWNKRNTSEPSNEAMTKGAKESFVETLNDNKALIRKRLKTSHLKFRQLKLGKSAKTPVVIAYIDNKAEKSIVDGVEKRLKSADIDVVLDYGCLQPFIDTDVKTFFSCVGVTERPDTLCSKLTEGRVAVIVDGSPFVMYVPYLFSDNFQSVDDYDNPPFYAGFLRILKYFSFFASIFLPGLYVAIGTFHIELLPTQIVYHIAAAEAITPFSLVYESVLTFLLYEVMREAGLRLPKTIGHAISIIGALVIGEATVSAGLIGAPTLIVVAVTAISSYVVYPLYESTAVLRLFSIIIGGITGIYGIILFAGIVGINLCSVGPFGIPYSAPFSPFTKESAADSVFRASWKKLKNHRFKIQDLRGASVEKDV